jgi:putative acetyltransferase
VAEEAGQVIGHIVFSPVTMVGRPELRLTGLAPMAVSSPHRNKGIGSALVRRGLHRCARLGFDAVVVLGHAAYDPRFGFQPAARFGMRRAGHRRPATSTGDNA